MNTTDLTALFVSPHQTMLEVMQRINETSQGISLVVDSEGRLVDTVTDGDLRRAVLAELIYTGPCPSCGQKPTGLSRCQSRLRGTSSPASFTGQSCVTSHWWMTTDAQWTWSN